MFDVFIIFAIVAVSVAGAYGIFELLVHRKERLKMIEKMGSDINPELLKPRFAWPVPTATPHSRGYGALKAAGLLIGIGLGLLVAFFIYMKTVNTGHLSYETRSILYGASVLLFGGLGLLTAFLIEIKMRKKQ